MKSNSTKQTAALAKTTAKKLLENSNGPVVIALSGDLGASKTFFTRNFLKALGVKEKVTSPTFVIMREYKLQHEAYKKAYHLDVYRLEPKDLKVLGFQKIIKEKDAILLIEWAEKVKKLLPKETVWIRFKHGKKKNERIITIK